MSITTSSICLSKYVGLPIDIANCIARYAGTEKWIPQFDTKGKFYRKVNPAYFDELSYICYIQPDIASGRTTHTVVLNNSQRYETAMTIVQRRHICDNGDMQVTLYTSIEVARGVFNYLSITYVITPYSMPLHEFVKGTFHRPSEPLSWNQQQQITSFRMENNVMCVNYAEYQVEYVWNEQLNFGEYIVDTQPMYDEQDNMTWAL
jgi:hypothetical protein